VVRPTPGLPLALSHLTFLLAQFVFACAFAGLGDDQGGAEQSFQLPHPVGRRAPALVLTGLYAGRPAKPTEQMRWSPQGAHLLLQVRTRVLKNQLADDFHRWYPELTHTADRQPLSAWPPPICPALLDRPKCHEAREVLAWLLTWPGESAVIACTFPLNRRMFYILEPTLRIHRRDYTSTVG